MCSSLIWILNPIANSSVAVFIIVIRATTVRLTIRKLLRIGWLYLLPLAVINILASYIIFVWLA